MKSGSLGMSCDGCSVLSRNFNMNSDFLLDLSDEHDSIKEMAIKE
jgi:hypothetical protein